MNEWWLDLAFLSMTLICGYLFWQIETYDIDGKDATPDDELMGHDSWEPAAKRRSVRVYPATLIRQAGLLPEQMRPLYWSAKLVTGLLAPLLALEILGPGLATWELALLGVAGSFLPEVFLLARRANRRRSIAGSLGFFISLLVVYLKSGVNLAQGFRQAAAYGLRQGSPLAQELELLSREIDAGRDRDAAFSMLAARTGVEPVKRLASVIAVGYRTGSPVAATLQAQAELLRTRQAQQATELVNRKSMEIMLPMLLVCFPMFVVLVLFPAAVQLLQVLDMIGELF